MIGREKKIKLYEFYSQQKKARILLGAVESCMFFILLKLSLLDYMPFGIFFKSAEIRSTNEKLSPSNKTHLLIFCFKSLGF